MCTDKKTLKSAVRPFKRARTASISSGTPMGDDEGQPGQGEDDKESDEAELRTYLMATD
jgi:hypothetical protein